MSWRGGGRGNFDLPWKEVKPKKEKTEDGRYVYKGASTPEFYDTESQQSSHNPYTTSIPSADPYVLYGAQERYAYTNEMFYDNAPYRPAAYKSSGQFVTPHLAPSDFSSSGRTGSSRRKPCIALAVAGTIVVILILIGVGVYFGTVTSGSSSDSSASASVEFNAELRMAGATWDPALADPTSAAFASMESQVLSDLGTIFGSSSSTSGTYQSATVNSFSSGSVVVTITLTFNAAGTALTAVDIKTVIVDNKNLATGPVSSTDTSALVVNIVTRTATTAAPTTTSVAPTTTSATPTTTVAAPATSSAAPTTTSVAPTTTSATPTTTGAAPTTTGAAPTTTGAAQTTTGAAQTTTGAAQTTTGAAPTTTGAAQQTTGAAPATTGAAQTTTGAAPTTTGAAPTTTGAAQTTTGAAQTTTGAALTTTGAAQTTTGAAQTTTGAAPATTGAAQTTTGAAPTTTGAAPTTTGAAQTTTGAAQTTTGAALTTTGAAQTTTGAAQTTTGAAPATTAMPTTTEATTVMMPPTNGTMPPMNVTMPPTNGTMPPMNATMPPTNGTMPPMNATMPPTNGTMPPMNATMPPTNGTMPPMNVTMPPTNSTMPPMNATMPPTNGTMPPMNATMPPTNGTMPPMNVTMPPTNGTMPPMNATMPPTNGTMPPMNITMPPTNGTMPPMNATMLPTNGTMPPMNATMPPTNGTMPPMNVTMPPTNGTMPPMNATMPPTNGTMPPMNATMPPTNGTMPPMNVTMPPTNGTMPTTTPEIVFVNETVPLPEFNVTVALEEEYNLNLENSSSPEYINLAQNVTEAMDKVYENDTNYNRTEVNGFSNGSIYVNFVVIFNELFVVIVDDGNIGNETGPVTITAVSVGAFIADKTTVLTIELGTHVKEEVTVSQKEVVILVPKIRTTTTATPNLNETEDECNLMTFMSEIPFCLNNLQQAINYRPMLASYGLSQVADELLCSLYEVGLSCLANTLPVGNCTDVSIETMVGTYLNFTMDFCPRENVLPTDGFCENSLAWYLVECIPSLMELILRGDSSCSIREQFIQCATNISMYSHPYFQCGFQQIQAATHKEAALLEKLLPGSSGCADSSAPDSVELNCSDIHSIMWHLNNSCQSVNFLNTNDPTDYCMNYHQTLLCAKVVFNGSPYMGKCNDIKMVSTINENQSKFFGGKNTTDCNVLANGMVVYRDINGNPIDNITKLQNPCDNNTILYIAKYNCFGMLEKNMSMPGIDLDLIKNNTCGAAAWTKSCVHGIMQDWRNTTCHGVEDVLKSNSKNIFGKNSSLENCTKDVCSSYGQLSVANHNWTNCMEQLITALSYRLHMTSTSVNNSNADLAICKLYSMSFECIVNSTRNKGHNCSKDALNWTRSAIMHVLNSYNLSNTWNNTNALAFDPNTCPANSSDAQLCILPSYVSNLITKMTGTFSLLYSATWTTGAHSMNGSDSHQNMTNAAPHSPYPVNTSHFQSLVCSVYEMELGLIQTHLHRKGENCTDSNLQHAVKSAITLSLQYSGSMVDLSLLAKCNGTVEKLNGSICDHPDKLMLKLASQCLHWIDSKSHDCTSFKAFKRCVSEQYMYSTNAEMCTQNQTTQAWKEGERWKNDLYPHMNVMCDSDTDINETEDECSLTHSQLMMFSSEIPFCLKNLQAAIQYRQMLISLGLSQVADELLCSLQQVGLSCLAKRLHVDNCTHDSIRTMVGTYFNFTMDFCPRENVLPSAGFCENSLAWYLVECIPSLMELILRGDSPCSIREQFMQCATNISMYSHPYFQCGFQQIQAATHKEAALLEKLLPGSSGCSDSSVSDSVEFNAELRMLHETWDPALAHPTSAAYDDLGGRVLEDLDTIFRSDSTTSDSYQMATALSFSSGSVVCNAILTFSSAGTALTADHVRRIIVDNKHLATGPLSSTDTSALVVTPVLPELNCSDINSIMWHLNNSCKSVNFLNTNDTTNYCMNYHQTLLCAKVVFNGSPYMGKCNDSKMVSTIQENQSKFFVVKNTTDCNALVNGMVVYRDINGHPIDNITKLQNPCDNNTILYIAKYNCFGMLEKNMSMPEFDRDLIKNNTCGAAAWTKSCVNDTMQDWRNTTCHAVEDVLKSNSKNIFGRNSSLENCTKDVCSSYGQLSVANHNWTICMEQLITALFYRLQITSTSINKNDADLAICKLYNMSFECIVNSTRNKGHNCSKDALNWTRPAIMHVLNSYILSNTWNNTNALAFDPNTCPANTSDAQLCILPSYVSNLIMNMTGTFSLLYSATWTTGVQPMNGSDTHHNMTTGSHPMNGSDSHQNMTTAAPQSLYPVNTSHFHSLVCSVYEMELGLILTHLHRKGEKCNDSNLQYAVKSAIALSLQYSGSKVDLSLLAKCNRTVEKLNGSICDHPDKLMLKLASHCLHWIDSKSHDCTSFKAFKRCVSEQYMYSTNDEMCTQNQTAQAWKEGERWTNDIYPHVNFAMCDSDDTDKPGKCPTPPSNTSGVCWMECSEDTACSENQKCCFNGCGHTCQAPVLPELNCSDINSIMWHLNNSCQSVNFLNTNDTTKYCKNYHQTLLCAKVVFNGIPYEGKCNDSKMVSTIQENQSKFFGGKNTTVCNALVNGMVVYRDINDQPIDNITKLQDPCDNNTLQYIAKYNCFGMLEKNMSMPGIDRVLITNDTCGAAAWTKSCVHGILQDWRNTTCHAVEDVLKSNSNNIFGKNSSLENCTKDVCSSYGQLSVANPNWTTCMEQLTTALFYRLHMTSTSVNNNDVDLAICKLYNMSFECIVNSTRNKGHNCSKDALNWTRPAIMHVLNSYILSNTWNNTNALAFDPNTCPANTSDAQLCILPSYVSNLIMNMTGTFSLLYSATWTTGVHPMNGSDTHHNMTTGSHPMNGSDSHQNMTTAAPQSLYPVNTSHFHSLVCSVYEMELGLILTHLHRKGEKCNDSNLQYAVKSAIALSLQYSGSKVDLSLLAKCNRTVEKLNGSICDHPDKLMLKLMLKLASHCLHWIDSKSHDCTSFKAFKRCVSEQYMYSTNDEMCTPNQTAQAWKEGERWTNDIYPHVNFAMCDSDDTDKPGKCPTPPSNTSGVCWMECSEDTACSENQKCCFNGCGHTCQAPVLPELNCSDINSIMWHLNNSCKSVNFLNTNDAVDFCMNYHQTLLCAKVVFSGSPYMGKCSDSKMVSTINENQSKFFGVKNTTDCNVLVNGMVIYRDINGHPIDNITKLQNPCDNNTILYIAKYNCFGMLEKNMSMPGINRDLIKNNTCGAAAWTKSCVHGIVQDWRNTTCHDVEDVLESNPKNIFGKNSSLEKCTKDVCSSFGQLSVANHNWTNCMEQLITALFYRQHMASTSVNNNNADLAICKLYSMSFECIVNTTRNKGHNCSKDALNWTRPAIMHILNSYNLSNTWNDTNALAFDPTTCPANSSDAQLCILPSYVSNLIPDLTGTFSLLYLATWTTGVHSMNGSDSHQNMTNAAPHSPYPVNTSHFQSLVCSVYEMELGIIQTHLHRKGENCTDINLQHAVKSAITLSLQYSGSKIDLSLLAKCNGTVEKLNGSICDHPDKLMLKLASQCLYWIDSKSHDCTSFKAFKRCVSEQYMYSTNAEMCTQNQTTQAWKEGERWKNDLYPHMNVTMCDSDTDINETEDECSLTHSQLMMFSSEIPFCLKNLQAAIQYRQMLISLGLSQVADELLCSLQQVGLSCLAKRLHVDNCTHDSIRTMVGTYFNFTMDFCPRENVLPSAGFCENSLAWYLVECIPSLMELILRGDSPCSIREQFMQCATNISMYSHLYFQCGFQQIQAATHKEAALLEKLLPGSSGCSDSSVSDSVEFNAELRMLHETWDPALADPTSAAYDDLGGRVLEDLDTIFRSDSTTSDSYQMATALSFSSGSVVCNAILTFSSAGTALTADHVRRIIVDNKHLATGPLSSTDTSALVVTPVLPELNCSDINSIMWHLNNSCKSVNFLNTNDTTNYCMNYHQTLLCAKVVFNGSPYMGKCNDSKMVSTIQENQSKFFGVKNTTDCNALVNGMVVYRDINGHPIDNITKLQNPCDNNTILYIAKYNCFGMLEKNMSMPEFDRDLIKNNTCGAAAWTKSCVNDTMQDWRNTTCHAVEDVLKSNSKNIFGRNSSLENCTKDVCSSYGQLSVANHNWTTCMEQLIRALFYRLQITSTSINKNDADLAICKLYNMSFECIVNSTRNKGHNCSKDALNWTRPAIMHVLNSYILSNTWNNTNALAFDPNTCPANTSDAQLCILPSYVSNLIMNMTGTFSLLYSATWTTGVHPMNGSDTHHNMTTGSHPMNGSDSHQNMTTAAPQSLYPVNTSHFHSLVCSVYEMELGLILTHLHRKGEKCNDSNLQYAVKSAIALSLQYSGSKVDLSLLAKCNRTVEKLNGSICDHPDKLMLKLASHCLHWIDSKSHDCTSFKAFKRCVSEQYMYSTNDEMCTPNQTAQAWKEGERWTNDIYPHVNFAMCDSDDTDKPGKCPTPPSNTSGVCWMECSEDTACSENQKCCFNGCGHTCQAPVLPELNCSDINSIMWHLNNSCQSVNFLNTNDTTKYCKNYHQTLLCAKVVFNGIPYEGKCNDSKMVSTIQENQSKFFGGKNTTVCNALVNGMVVYRDINDQPIDNITKLQDPCDNNTLQYIAKYNCFGMLEKNMSMPGIDRVLITNDTCGAAAWTKSCVHGILQDWRNTTCHAVEDVLKSNSNNIFGKNSSFENCTKDVCSSYGQLSVANPNWTTCMEQLTTALFYRLHMTSTSVNNNDVDLAICKLYNMSFECIVNSTRNKGHNCSKDALNWTRPAIMHVLNSYILSNTWNNTNALAFDPNTCPANTSDAQLCILPSYVSNLIMNMTGTFSLLYSATWTTGVHPMNGSDTHHNMTTGSHPMNGSDSHQNMTTAAPQSLYPVNTSHFHSLVCSVYEMELGLILTHLHRKGEKCNDSNLQYAVKSAIALSLQYSGSKVDLSLLAKCNRTVEKLNGSICDHPDKLMLKLMLKLASHCLHWIDSKSHDCTSFKAFKRCVSEQYMYSTNDEMCTQNQTAQAWKEGERWTNDIYPHVNFAMCDSDDTDKPGKCPTPPSNTSGVCWMECSEDTACSENQKCCFNGCGHTCQAPVLPELNCSDINSIMWHLNNSCQSVNFLNTNDTTKYCKNYHQTLLCAKVVFNGIPYEGKCNDSKMVSTIQENQSKFFGGKNTTVCNALVNGMVVYRDINDQPIDNITKLQDPCDNNTLQYIAKYNCFGMLEKNMSMPGIDRVLITNDTCGAAAWTKSCVHGILQDWRNTTCHAVEDVLKSNSNNIFGKNSSLENCTKDVCSSYGQLSVANPNWTTCMEQLTTALFYRLHMTSTSVNNNDVDLAICKLYNMSFECIVNSTRNKGHNCSKDALNWTRPAIMHVLNSYILSNTWNNTNALAFDPNTCPANTSDAQLCILPSYVSNLIMNMTGTFSLLYSATWTTGVHPMNGSDTHHNMTTGSHPMNGSDSHQNMTTAAPQSLYPVNTSHFHSLVCSVYEMELGLILTHLHRKGEKCNDSNLQYAVKSAIALSLQYSGSKVDLSLLAKCNRTVEKLNGSICDHPDKLMLKLASHCLHWIDSKSHDCTSFKAFKRCVSEQYMYSTNDEMCTPNQTAQAWKEGERWTNDIYPHVNFAMCDSDDTDKPGKCHTPPSNTSGVCWMECSEDTACSENQKCCFNGCGHTCQAPVLPELNCSDINSIMWHLNNSCQSVNFLNTNDTTKYCKNYHQTLLCAKVVFNGIPYEGKCNDSKMVSTIQENQSKFFGGKNTTVCNALVNGMVVYRDINDQPIDNITKLQDPCDNNTLQYIAKYNCFGMLEKNMSMPGIDRVLIMNDTCGAAAWTKSCVHGILQDWRNTTCHAVEDVLKSNSNNIFGKNSSLENCTKDVCSSYGQLSVANPNWTTCMEQLTTALFYRLHMTSTSVNNNDVDLAICKLYNMSFECIVNSTRNKGHNCSKDALNWTRPAIMHVLNSYNLSNTWNNINASAFDPNTCPANISDAQLCVLPTYLSNQNQSIFTDLRGTFSLLFLATWTTGAHPMNGSDTHQNMTTGAHSMNGSDSYQNMTTGAHSMNGSDSNHNMTTSAHPMNGSAAYENNTYIPYPNYPLNTSYLQSLLCSVYEMELGLILTHLHRKGEKCTDSNLQYAVKSAITLSFHYSGSTVDLSLLAKCNGTVEKLNGFICDHPYNLMLKLASQCLHWWDPQSHDCTSFKAFKRCVSEHYMYSTNNEMCTQNQTAQAWKEGERWKNDLYPHVNVTMCDSDDTATPMPTPP